MLAGEAESTTKRCPHREQQSAGFIRSLKTRDYPFSNSSENDAAATRAE